MTLRRLFILLVAGFFKMILVFPAPGCTYEAPLDVTVETSIEGHWRTIGTDRILPRP